jgi:hypothetical protein
MEGLDYLEDRFPINDMRERFSYGYRKPGFQLFHLFQREKLRKLS